VDARKSVVGVEHHQAVMAHADWIIDLSPGAGHDGGRIVVEGTPAVLVAARSTLTGESWRSTVGGLTPRGHNDGQQSSRGKFAAAALEKDAFRLASSESPCGERERR
jgi:hypothetical protein